MPDNQNIKTKISAEQGVVSYSTKSSVYAKLPDGLIVAANTVLQGDVYVSGTLSGPSIGTGGSGNNNTSAYALRGFSVANYYEMANPISGALESGVCVLARTRLLPTSRNTAISTTGGAAEGMFVSIENNDSSTYQTRTDWYDAAATNGNIVAYPGSNIGDVLLFGVELDSTNDPINREIRYKAASLSTTGGSAGGIGGDYLRVGKASDGIPNPCSQVDILGFGYYTGKRTAEQYADMFEETVLSGNLGDSNSFFDEYWTVDATPPGEAWVSVSTNVSMSLNGTVSHVTIPLIW